MQRLRIRFAKRGRMRFVSHRDFSRAFERAVFRARIPMAYSSGFNPHPRISFAGAAPTGAASEAEYLEIALAERLDPDAVLAALGEALPDGLDLMRVIESRGGSLADGLEASRWLIEVNLDRAPLDQAIAAFLAADTVTVERMTKKGLRSFDARAAVVALSSGEGDHGVHLDVVVRHQEPSVRPDDVVAGLRTVSELPELSARLITRLIQGSLGEDGVIGDPFDLRPPHPSPDRSQESARP